MTKILLVALAVLGWAGLAEARCSLPKLEVVWSYPAAGEVDVPTNAELWVVVPWAWWNPVVRLDGREVSYVMSSDASGVVHVVPTMLEANHDYVLQLDFTSTRSGEDAGANAVIEISFRTGTSRVEALAAPELGAYSASEPLYQSPTVSGSCPDVILAQACLDTGPNTLHSFEPRGAKPLAWLVGDHVEPARCEAPQVLTRANTRGGECFPVRAIGPGGRTSEPTTACIPVDRSREPNTITSDASAEPTAAASDPASTSSDDGGCRTAPGESGVAALPLLLAFLLRRRSSNAT